jgi:MFS family permease
MVNPWFNPIMYAWIPGTALGIVGGLYGAIVGMLAPRGKAKKLILGLHFSLIFASAVLLILGIAAYFLGQPYGIWYGFILPGIIGIVVIGALTPVIFNRYQEAELRKTISKDI